MRSTLIAIGLAGAAIAAPQPVQRRQVVSLASTLVPSAASTPALASSSATAASSSASASASAAPNVTASFLAAVRARNADAFASLLEGQPALVQQIVSLAGSSQPYTVILPGSLDNVAIDTSNSTLVAQLVQYHILPGNYTVASLPVNQTNIVPTALTNYRGTQGAQVLVFAKNVYGTTVVGGASNATILANSTFSNFLFKLADRALTLPTNISTTVQTQPESTVLGGALANFPQLVQQADSAQAITVFAPENSAIQQALAQLGAGGLTSASNSTIQQIIGNHIVTGQTIYSTNLTSAQNVQNANGGAVTFTANSTGAYVTSGGNTAKIVRADINAINGVVHIIDAPLFAANASTASTGSSSASSAASSASGIASTAVSSASSAASSASSAASSVATAVSSASAAVSSVASA